MVATLTLLLRLPQCHSLKEKRGWLQPLLHQLRRKFNLSVAEMDFQDVHQQALITCAMVGNDSIHLRAAMEHVRRWVQGNLSEGSVVDEKIEIL